MNEQERKNIAEALKKLYYPVVLQCDNYKVTLMKKQVADNKLGITFYVDGYFKMKWFFVECEERKRFLRPVPRAFYTQKEKALFKKMKKSMLKSLGVEPNKKINQYFHYWLSAKSMLNHFIKNNNEVKLISIGSFDGSSELKTEYLMPEDKDENK